MDMMDLYNLEEAQAALDEAVQTKVEFMNQIEELNKMIFILTHFIKTGEPLDPAVFGIEDPEEESDE